MSAPTPQAEHTAEAPQAIAAERPLLGEWRYSTFYVCCGTIRVFKIDIDTNPAPEFCDELMAWVCERLNATEATAADRVMSAEDRVKAMYAAIVRLPIGKECVDQAHEIMISALTAHATEATAPLHAEIAELRSVVAELRDHRSRQLSLTDELRADLAARDQKIAGLKSDLGKLLGCDLHAIITTQQATIQRLEGERDEARQDRDSLWLAIFFGAQSGDNEKKSIRDAEQYLAADRAERDTLREQVKRLEVERDYWIKEHTAQANARVELEAERDTLRAQLARMEEALRSCYNEDQGIAWADLPFFIGLASLPAKPEEKV